jgi:hypothetical protein
MASIDAGAYGLAAPVILNDLKHQQSKKKLADSAPITLVYVDMINEARK